MEALHLMYRWSVSLVAVPLLALAGCMSMPPASQPIPVREVKASEKLGERLVVVLPGRGDDLDNLTASGIATELQRQVPGTDVLLVEATFRYYMEGRLVPRLHEEIILPARQRGYREIWLAGASMGGLGVLMYEHEHPGALTGLVLMAPYMGPTSIQKEIRTAGGVASWNPGPRPASLDRDNVYREEWRVVKAWLDTPERARNVWLICGEDDRLLPAAEMVAPVLPPDHVLRRPGGHRWTVWSPAAADALAMAVAKNKPRDAQTTAAPTSASGQQLLLAF